MWNAVYTCSIRSPLSTWLAPLCLLLWVWVIGYPRDFRHRRSSVWCLTPLLPYAPLRWFTQTCLLLQHKVLGVGTEMSGGWVGSSLGWLFNLSWASASCLFGWKQIDSQRLLPRSWWRGAHFFLKTSQVCLKSHIGFKGDYRLLFVFS